MRKTIIMVIFIGAMVLLPGCDGGVDFSSLPAGSESVKNNGQGKEVFGENQDQNPVSVVATSSAIESEVVFIESTFCENFLETGGIDWSTTSSISARNFVDKITLEIANQVFVANVNDSVDIGAAKFLDYVGNVGGDFCANIMGGDVIANVEGHLSIGGLDPSTPAKLRYIGNVSGDLKLKNVHLTYIGNLKGSLILIDSVIERAANLEGEIILLGQSEVFRQF